MRLHPADVRLSRWCADHPTNVRLIPLQACGPSPCNVRFIPLRRAAHPVGNVRFIPLVCGPSYQRAAHPVASVRTFPLQCAVHPVDVRLIPSTCGIIQSAVQLNEECTIRGIGVCCEEHAKHVGAGSQQVELSTQPNGELLEAVGAAEEA